MSMLFGGGGAGNKLPTVHFLRVSDSQWGIVWPVLYGRARLPSHTIWIGDQRAVENTGPGKGLEGASGGGVFYTYYASLINAFCLGPVNGFGRAYNTGNGGLRRFSAAHTAANWSEHLGALGQAPWSFLASHHPGQDLGYTGIAYLSHANLNLGTSAVLPQTQFEVFGFLPYSTGIKDADASAVIQDMIANPAFGMSPDATWIDSAGTFADLTNYIVANGFFISPTFDQQKPGREWLQLIFELIYADAVWSEGQLRAVPYSTDPTVGNGVTWRPNLTPVCSFSDDDFRITSPSDNELIVKVVDPLLRNNVIRIEFLNVLNDYNIEPMEVMDESDIVVHQRLPAPTKQYHPIPTAGMAGAIGRLQLQKALAINRSYEFTVAPTKIALVDPMDVVALSSPFYGLNDQLVRVVSTEETGDPENDRQGRSDLEVSVVCEDLAPSAQVAFIQGGGGGGGGSGTLFVAAGDPAEYSSVSAFPAGETETSPPAVPLAVVEGGATGLNEPAQMICAPNPAAAGQLLWVADPGAVAVYAYPVGANGNAPPTYAITGAATLLQKPSDVGIGPDGSIYVADQNASAIFVYAAEATGNVAPIRTITGATTTLVLPVYLAVDSNGLLYVNDVALTGLLIFAAGANGDVAPIATLSSTAAFAAFSPNSIRVDASNNLWCLGLTNTDAPYGVAFMFAARAWSGPYDVAPTNTIQLPPAAALYDTDYPLGLAFDAAGNLYVAYYTLDPNTFVASYAPGATGAATPLSLLTLGYSTGGLSPQPGIAIAGSAPQFPPTLGGIGNPIQPGGGSSPTDPGSTPGSVNAPIFVEPHALVPNPYTLWVAVSGVPDPDQVWGGANVWMSDDGGTTYRQIGAANQPAIMGTLTAPLPASADPDTTDTLYVDLSESGGVVSSIATAQADKGYNLAWVDGEYIAFAMVGPGQDPTNPNAFGLTYLRRGLYGSPITAHAVGAAFFFLNSATFLDLGVTAVTYPNTDVGVALMFKFASFNNAGGAPQDLSTVTAFSYTPVGP